MLERRGNSLSCVSNRLKCVLEWLGEMNTTVTVECNNHFFFSIRSSVQALCCVQRAFAETFYGTFRLKRITQNGKIKIYSTSFKTIRLCTPCLTNIVFGLLDAFLGLAAYDFHFLRFCRTKLLDIFTTIAFIIVFFCAYELSTKSSTIITHHDVVPIFTAAANFAGLVYF